MEAHIALDLSAACVWIVTVETFATLAFSNAQILSLTRASTLAHFLTLSYSPLGLVLWELYNLISLLKMLLQAGIGTPCSANKIYFIKVWLIDDSGSYGDMV